ncbi:MAG: hypothetical protein HYT63_03550 [Candidatus Yanofskybacteria bacterium]|nr:hypothetical protein [Candidatus Yanofskybacteria bacterium]
MPKIKVLYHNETTKKLIEKYGFEAVPLRDPTPEEKVVMDNFDDLLCDLTDEAAKSGETYTEDTALAFLISSLILSATP